jgi:putative ABC transport system permease protein
MPNSAFLDDLRFAFRHVRRRPWFAATVATTLAITIAAATTAFGLSAAVLWKPLPFDDAERLVFVWEGVARDGQEQAARVSGARYAAWLDSGAGLASLAAFGAAGFTLDSPSGATSIRGVRVSGSFFSTLGIRAALGRTFDATDETAGHDRVVILSHALWRDRFGGRADVIGESLSMSGVAYTIVGVMPPVVFPAWPVNPSTVTIDPESRMLWVPLVRTPQMNLGSSHVYGVVARLAPGVTLAHAQNALAATHERGTDRHGTIVRRLREQFVSDARTPLLTLAAAALAVLFIACANLAALHVSAFEARRGELSLRAAVGAGIARLLRQLSAETLWLALAGGLGGLILARVALATLPSLLPPTLPFMTPPALDIQVALFGVALAAVAGMLLTAWPIARLLIAAPAPRGVAAPARSTVYRTLIVSQIATTVALAFSAGVLMRSLYAVQSRDPGFAIDRVFVADVGFNVGTRPAAAAVAAAEQRVLSRVAAVPGIVGVAAAYDHPLEANWSDAFPVTGDITTDDQVRPGELRIVSPAYFEMLDVALIDGRLPRGQDDVSAPGVAVVNEAFARELGGHALGRRVRSGGPRFTYGTTVPGQFEIVGIVGNERSRGLEEPAPPAVYLSTLQFPQPAIALIAKTAGDPVAIAGSIRSALRELDPAITVSRVASLEGLLSEQLLARRVTAKVVGAFAAAALMLAALGMYGLLAMLVAGRVREIGVRLALGATPALVATSVLRDSVQSAAAGVAIGCALAWAGGRLMQGMLVGVTASDPLTLIGVVVLLLAVAALAAGIPARRAARVEPIVALRAE